MGDFFQHGSVTTLHDLGSAEPDELVDLLVGAVDEYPIGLVLPVTASDMRAAPFERIVEELRSIRFIDQIIVTLGAAPEADDYREALRRIGALGDRARLLWADGSRVGALYRMLETEGLNLGNPGKGRSVWTAFGYLLADPRLRAFVLHDCDIVNYERSMLARLCLPMVHPSLDFEFCKAYYARFTDKMHGRVARLLIRPLLQALRSTLGQNDFLIYMDSFRYPLSGEFAVTSNLARVNRIPSDWGLEIGALAEVYRNTSVKRVCQVDMCGQYEHKHQALSLEDADKGLIGMGRQIIVTFLRTLSSMGIVFPAGYFATLRSTYLHCAQDAIRQYGADSVMNCLLYDRHAEEGAIEKFAEQISVAGELFLNDPLGGQAIPNWNRVRAAFPDFPNLLRDAVDGDVAEFG